MAEMDIKHTRHKLASVGKPLKRFNFASNDAKKRVILQKHCDKAGITPVYRDAPVYHKKKGDIQY